MSGGMTMNSLDMREDDHRIFFDLFSGLYDGLTLVGEDDDLPEAAGMDPQPRRAIRRDIELRGELRGIGDDLAERREDLDAAFLELFTALDIGTGTPYQLTLTGPYLGIPTGETRTIGVRYDGHEWSDPDPDWARRVMILRLFSVDSPPDWVVES